MTYRQPGPKQIDGVSGAFLALTWLTVGARCYVRAVMIKNFGIEDWFALASLLFFTLYCVSTFEGALHGFGKMRADLSNEQMVDGLKAWWFSGVLYVATNGFLKASIAVQLLKLTEKKIHRRAIQLVLGLSITYITAFDLFLLFRCLPVQYFWTSVNGGQGFCISFDTVGVFSIVSSVFNISADWFFAVIPCILVKDLALPARTKVTVSLILAFGGLASCAVLIRLPYLVLLQRNSKEVLYYCTWVINCSTAENGLGISAAAMATLRPLFRSFLSASRTISNSSTRHSGCLKLGGSSRPRSTSGYIRNIEDADLEVGLNTIRKKLSRKPDGTLEVIEETIQPRSASQLELRGLPTVKVDLSDRKLEYSDERSSALPDSVIQKL